MQNKIGIFNTIGLRLGGFNIKASKKCTESEIEENARAGYTLLASFVIAFFSYSFCFFFFTDDITLSGILGFIFAAVIISIDRALITLTDLSKFSISSLIRFFLAICLAGIMAEPLILGIYQDAVKEEQYTVLTHKIKETEAPFDRKIEKKEAILQEQRYDVKLKRDEYIDELDGSGGSGKKGEGIIAKRKEKAFSDAQKDLIELERWISEEIKQIKLDKSSAVAGLESSVANGLLGSIKTLHNIAEKETVVFYSSWAIRICLILIELLPILIKISRSKGKGVYYNVIGQENIETLEYLNKTAPLSTQKKVLEHSNLLNAEIQAAKLRAINLSADHELEMIKTLIAKLMVAIQVEQEQFEKVDKANIPEKHKNDVAEKIKVMFTDFMATFETYMTANFNK